MKHTVRQWAAIGVVNLMLACGGGSGGGDDAGPPPPDQNDPAQGSPGNEQIDVSKTAGAQASKLALGLPDFSTLSSENQSAGLKDYTLEPVPFKMQEPQAELSKSLANSGALAISTSTSLVGSSEPFECSDPSSNKSLAKTVWCELWDNESSTRLSFMRDSLPDIDSRIEGVKEEALKGRRHCLVRAPSTYDYNPGYTDGTTKVSVFAEPVTLACKGNYGSGSGWYAAGQFEEFATYVDGSGQGATAIKAKLDGSELEIREYEPDSVLHALSYKSGEENMLEIAFAMKGTSCGARMVANTTYAFLQGYQGGTTTAPMATTIGCAKFGTTVNVEMLYEEKCVKLSDFSDAADSNCTDLKDPTKIKTRFITWTPSTGTTDLSGGAAGALTPEDLVTAGKIASGFVYLAEDQFNSVISESKDEDQFAGLLEFYKIDPASIIGDAFFKVSESGKNKIAEILESTQERLRPIVPTKDYAAGCLFKKAKPYDFSVPPADSGFTIPMKLQCSSGDSAQTATYGLVRDTWYFAEKHGDTNYLLTSSPDEFEARKLDAGNGNSFVQLLSSAKSDVFELAYVNHGQEVDCGGQLKTDGGYVYVKGYFPQNVGADCPDPSTAETEDFCLNGETLLAEETLTKCQESGLTSFTLPPVYHNEPDSSFSNFLTEMPTDLFDASAAFEEDSDLLQGGTIADAITKVELVPLTDQKVKFTRDPDNSAGVNLGHNCKFNRTDQEESSISFYQLKLGELSATQVASMTSNSGDSFLSFEVKSNIKTYFGGEGNTNLDLKVSLLNGDNVLTEKKIDSAEDGLYTVKVFEGNPFADSQTIRVDLTATGMVFCDASASGQPQAAVSVSLGVPFLHFQD